MPVATVRQPTAWTSRLQMAAGAVLAMGVGGFAVLPSVFDSMRTQMTAQIAQQAASDPNMTAADQTQLTQMMQSTFDVTLGFGLLLGIAMLVVLAVGVAKRWRWVYWYFMIVGILAPLNLLSLASSALGVYPYSMYRFPPVFYAFAALSAVAQLALAVVMIVARQRYGTWACVAVPVEQPEATAPLTPR